MPVNATFGSIVHAGIYRLIPVANTDGKCNRPTLLWIYEIQLFQLKFVYTSRNKGKINAVTYFLATLDTETAITRYLVTYRSEISCIRFALKCCVFEIYLKQYSKNIIFTTILATLYFKIVVKWCKSRIFQKFQLEHA